MELTASNPQKGRLEPIVVEFTNDNAIWFDNCKNHRDISMITDFDGRLLVKDCGYTYPLYAGHGPGC